MIDLDGPTLDHVAAVLRAKARGEEDTEWSAALDHAARTVEEMRTS